MPLKLDEVHTYDPKTGILDTKRNPYVRFSMLGSPPVYWQNKGFWSEGGDRISLDDLPSWVWEKVELMNTEYRHERLGLFTPTERDHNKRMKKKEKDKAKLSIVEESLESQEPAALAAGEKAEEA